MGNDNLSWTEVLAMLKHTHTLSYRKNWQPDTETDLGICGLLKATRQWVLKYITPNLDHIYLSNNISKEYSPDWVKAAAACLNREDMSESCYFSPSDFLNLINNSITASRQTHVIDVMPLIANKQAFLEERRKIDERLIELRDSIAQNPFNRSHLSEIRKLNKQRQFLFLDYISDMDRLIVTSGIVVPTSRADLLRTQVDVKVDSLDDLQKWKTTRQIKDEQPGITDEEIYRYLCKTGAIRISLNLSDKNGATSDKVYYVVPEEPIPEVSALITESAYQILKSKQSIAKEQKGRVRELTEEEKAEYHRMADNATQIVLDLSDVNNLE